MPKVNSPSFTFNDKNVTTEYVKNVGSSSSITSTDRTINCTLPNQTHTLPQASTCVYQTIKIKNSASSEVTLLAYSGEYIDGAPGLTLDSLECIEVQSDGVGWVILSSAIVSVTAYTKDPTGFIDGDNIVVNYNSTNRTITLTHASGYIDYMWQGTLKRLTSPWTSSAHSSTTDVAYFLSSVDGNNFTWSTTAWSFYDMMVAYVYFGATHKFALRETHGLMNWQSHRNAHANIGTYRTGGGDLSDFTLASTTATNRRPLVSACTVMDEDLQSVITAITNETNAYTQFYISGASTVNFVTGAADIVPFSGNQPYYNQLNGSTYQQTLLTNNQYMNIWLVAVPVTSDAGSQSYRFLWVQGQSASGTIATIQAETPRSLNLGTLRNTFSEFVFIARVMIRYSASNWTWIETASLTGSQYSQTGASSTGLTAVSIDGTLSGDGTPSNPLSKKVVVTSLGTNTVLGYITPNVKATSAITLTLPTAVGYSGFEQSIKNVSGGTVTINTTSSQTIDGDTSIDIYDLETLTVMSDGANWMVT